MCGMCDPWGIVLTDMGEVQKFKDRNLRPKPSCDYELRKRDVVKPPHTSAAWEDPKKSSSGRGCPIQIRCGLSLIFDASAYVLGPAGFGLVVGASRQELQMKFDIALYDLEVDTRLDYLRKEKLHKILVSDFLVRELGFRFWLNACGCGVCVCARVSTGYACFNQSESLFRIGLNQGHCFASSSAGSSP